jgi:hypothetical protein
MNLHGEPGDRHCRPLRGDIGHAVKGHNQVVKGSGRNIAPRLSETAIISQNPQFSVPHMWATDAIISRQDRLKSPTTKPSGIKPNVRRKSLKYNDLVWMPREDSNLDKRNQNPLSYL